MDGPMATADILEQACRAATVGRCAGRMLAAWAKPLGIGESELQLLWCLHQSPAEGLDQTTIAHRLALSAAQVSASVERLRQRGWTVQQAAAGDRRRHLWRLSEPGRGVVGDLLERIADSEARPQAEAAPVNESRFRIGRIAAAMLLVTAMVSTLGCTRAYYRTQADDEVNCIIDHKSMAVGAEPGEFRIDVDPRSRMYDGDDPDCPPMPPDDPKSHELMICVDCKPGAPCWRHAPTTPYVENPTWQDYLPRDDDGRIVLDMSGAVELARLQSTDYQEQLETLYLSSLDVTFERFRFDTQFFGGSSIFYTSDGRNRSGTGGSSSEFEVSPLAPGNRLRAQKFTTTGGELVVGLANSLVWQFSGPNGFSPSTTLDFTFVQPILRAGGRIRVMERLTIAERALLANVRQMEQYQQNFYLGVVTGQGFGNNSQLSRRGGFFGGSGLEGFSGVGGGGFGQIGGFGFGGFGVGQLGFTGGAGAQQAGGYLGLLQRAQVIRNQYANIASLGDSVEQLQAAHDAGRIDRFQVDLARQAWYNAQSQLLNSVAEYESTLDDFKLQYGMPPDLDLRIADPMLDQFNLLEPELATLRTRVTDLLSMLRGTSDAQAEVAADEGEGLEMAPDLPPEVLAEIAGAANDVVGAARKQVEIANEDLVKLDAALPARREALTKLANREDVRSAEISTDLLSPRVLDERAEATKKDLAELTTRLEVAWARLEGLSDSSLPPEQLRNQLTGALTQLSGELLELSLLQARARLDEITFEPVELTEQQGYCIASRYRRDWMNARANLVDSWRLIFFNADDLQSGLDLVFNGDIGNVGSNPLALDPDNARLQVGLEFDSPLTRLAERNIYRQSLIEYQQARRQYYQFRDEVHAGIRDTLRQMRLDELNFELRRAAVHVAITQVDLARLRLSEPARPVAAAAPGQPLAPGGESQFGDTVARDLVNALVDLLLVQNDFLSVWVDNEVQRLQLDFDLGIMQIDASGLRVEHDQPLAAFAENLPNTAPCEFPEPCAAVWNGTATEQEPGLQLGPQLELKLDDGEPDEGEALPMPESEALTLPLSRFTSEGKRAAANFAAD
jgi:DNA-binding MarR family transcriptional regulator